MREICIKQSESINRHRKDLSIVEMIEEKGMTARAEKKFSYHVFEQNVKGDPAQLEDWVKKQSRSNTHKDRHVSIRKSFDDKSGKGEMAYRVIGSFYVIQNLRIFAVVFMHSIKFDMLSGPRTDLAA